VILKMETNRDRNIHMADLQIHDARQEDQKVLLAVTLAAYQEYAPAMGDGWDLYRQNMLETLAAVKPAEQIVAEQDGVIVGTVLLYPAGTVFAMPSGETITLPAPEIRLLATVPQARGKGIGRVLVSECISRARKSGASH